MSYSGIHMGTMFKVLDRAGAHLACVLKIHDFNKKRICRKCQFVEMKVKE